MLKLNDNIIDNYKKLIYSIIKKYSNNYNNDDLFQAGMMGLIKASKYYDNKYNVKFTSFAYKYIVGEILKVLREDRNIKIGRDIISDYKKILFTKEYTYKKYGRNLSNFELSKILNMSEDRIREVISYNETCISLNNIISDDEKLSLEDILPSNNNIDSDMIDLKDAFNSLNNNEKELIIDRYYNNKTQTEIAKEKNLSQVKIYRYERKILDKMKDRML